MGCLNSKSVSRRQKARLTDGRASESGEKNATLKKAPNKIAASLKNEDMPMQYKSSPTNQHGSMNSFEQFLLSVLEGAEDLFCNLPESQAVKKVIALTFMNSCVEVTRTKFRLKFDVIIDMASKLTRGLRSNLLYGSLESVEERTMDDSFSRILLAWYVNNPSFEKIIPPEAGQAVLDTLYIRYTTTKPVTFEDILRFQFHWILLNQAAVEVYYKISRGKDLVSIKQLGNFLREVQCVETTDHQLMEKFKFRFGGGIHKYNFTSYNGSVLTNNAIDPARTSDIWQDMTQCFTHYMISCARIETENDLKWFINGTARALVLNIRKGDDGSICSGSCPLQTMLDYIKKNAFTTNTYPIILCFLPSSAFTIELQDEVAMLLNETLGAMLAKGPIFEGAIITDPKFNPSALRKKFLVMATQSALKPFIGFMVADMHKDGLGVRVAHVVEGTPAAKSGLLKDDWLTHINNMPIKNKKNLRECLLNLKVGEDFTIKRENLDEIKIVVGGIVDPDDTSASSALSAVTFFRFASGKDYKPCDVEVINTDKIPSLCDKNCDTYWDHLAFVSFNSTSNDTMSYEGVCSNAGIQFIDVDNSERSVAWSIGRFFDNGRCGYLLKTDADANTTTDLVMKIICGPRSMCCPPLSEMTVTVHGNGSVRKNGRQLTFTGTNVRTIVVVNMVFENDCVERSFTTSFCPLLIRPGYRALPSFITGDKCPPKSQLHGIYVFSSR
ncbi:unnamed protein product [Phytomonas sp. EM1]|nr:unnamed protein product [Phytomonas sp. EM1]|eukprot:CCW61727.1 unnamed protein product [Phytomonas sp. isolate EM1]